MLTLERCSRKGPVLIPSSLPCLGDMSTLNVTEGCAHGCTYCYARGYSSYPGEGRVVLIENLPELVRTELARKGRRPRRGYFSPSRDAFQPLPEIQAITYGTMATLLEAGVEVAFLTLYRHLAPRRGNKTTHPRVISPSVVGSGIVPAAAVPAPKLCASISRSFQLTTPS